jgi:hypothetical protein
LVPATVDGSQPASSQRPATEGLVLLKTGRILHGTAVREGDAMLVRLRGGVARVAYDDVLLVCRSLDEAYQIQASKLRADDLDAHVDLARWCLSNGLTEHARTELEGILRRDPDRRSARVMLQRLPLPQVQPRLETSRTAPTLFSPFEPAGPELAPTSDAITTVAADTAELPRLARKAFAVSIQPVLFDSCGRSGCHGPKSTTPLRLMPLPRTRRDNRKSTEENLHAVLRYVDFEHPAESPILLVPMRKHGRAVRPVFADPNSLDYRKLAAWVFAIGNDAESARSLLPAPPPPAPGPDPQQIENLPPEVRQMVENLTIPPIGAKPDDPSDEEDPSDEIDPYDSPTRDEEFLKKLLEAFGKRKK